MHDYFGFEKVDCVIKTDADLAIVFWFCFSFWAWWYSTAKLVGYVLDKIRFTGVYDPLAVWAKFGLSMVEVT